MIVRFDRRLVFYQFIEACFYVNVWKVNLKMFWIQNISLFLFHLHEMNTSPPSLSLSLIQSIRLKNHSMFISFLTSPHLCTFSRTVISMCIYLKLANRTESYGNKSKHEDTLNLNLHVCVCCLWWLSLFLHCALFSSAITFRTHIEYISQNIVFAHHFVDSLSPSLK